MEIAAVEEVVWRQGFLRDDGQRRQVHHLRKSGYVACLEAVLIEGME